MKDACDYMEIICYGTVFVFGYNAVCSIMKGLGDSKSPLYFVMAATVINIALDLVLVGPLGIGTAGALSSSRIFPALELRRSIFLSIHSPYEVFGLLPKDLHLYQLFFLPFQVFKFPF